MLLLGRAVLWVVRGCDACYFVILIDYFLINGVLIDIF